MQGKCLFLDISRPGYNVHVLTLYLIETLLTAFAKRADPDQAALVRAA